VLFDVELPKPLPAHPCRPGVFFARHELACDLNLARSVANRAESPYDDNPTGQAGSGSQIRPTARTNDVGTYSKEGNRNSPSMRISDDAGTQGADLHIFRVCARWFYPYRHSPLN
jgi:hypothetical protein